MLFLLFIIYCFLLIKKKKKKKKYVDRMMVSVCKCMVCLVVEINLFCFQGKKEEREACKRCLAKFKKCTKKVKILFFMLLNMQADKQ